MKRFLALMLALLAFTASLPCAAPAETILWEDENGQVIRGDDGSIGFAPASSPAMTEEPGPVPTPTPTPEPTPTPKGLYVKGETFYEEEGIGRTEKHANIRRAPGGKRLTQVLSGEQLRILGDEAYRFNLI